MIRDRDKLFISKFNIVFYVRGHRYKRRNNNYTIFLDERLIRKNKLDSRDIS